MKMTIKFFTILVFLSLSHCSYFKAAMPQPEYTVRNYNPIKMQNFHASKKVYIKPLACMFPFCQEMLHNIESELRISGTSIVTTKHDADYILSIDFKVMSITDGSTAKAMRDFISYSEVVPSFSFDGNNSPHITSDSQQLMELAKRAKSDGEMYDIRSETFLTSGAAIFTGAVVYLASGSQLLLTGGLSFGAAGLAYITYNQFKNIGNISVAEITLEERLSKPIERKRKTVNKISDNTSEEVLLIDNDHWHKMSSKVVAIGLGSKIFTEDMSKYIVDLVEKSAVSIFKQ